MGRKYLKISNVPATIAFLIWSIALFVVLCNGVTDLWGSLHQKVIDLKAKDSLFCFLTPIILSIACGLLPASWKAVLVFWRVRNPLPGCRAFSHFVKSDPRINASQLESSLGGFPENPTEQNSRWYQLYKAVQDEITVHKAHKEFLLNRDLAGIAVLFLCFGTLALIPSGAKAANILIYAAVTTVEFIAFSITARNHGNRFVCNVMVEYLSKE